MVVKNRLFNMLLISFFISLFSWEFLYFSIGEGVVMGISIYLSCLFLRGWYLKVSRRTTFFNEIKSGIYLYLLPMIALFFYLVTLRTAASWDVSDSFSYTLLYLLLGIAWLSLSFSGMLLFWAFSYEDDVLMSQNRSSMIMLTGAVIGSSLIYAGANIGDGPGWWTVVFAGGLGTVSWLLLGMLINFTTGIINRITVDRDINSGIRFSAYLVASGLILARGSAGNWLSFTRTIVDFTVAWPVLLMVILMILFELLLFKPQEIVTS
ncbi:hypothetical protein [Enterococcus rivorum]|uniref:hypothetical protein n=1 Tax=Enterococcus rivorum TaxID=762845 RepID=UPI0036252CA9